MGHIFSSKGNDNEEETTWSCHNCTNPRECGKSERGRREESNPFCLVTCCQIGNGQKHGKANLTQRFGIPSLQNDDHSDVKRRVLSIMFSLCRANARNYRRKWGHNHHNEWWNTFPPKWFSKQTTSDTGPHKIPIKYERWLHSPKVTIWCAIGKVGIIGPYFFEENEIITTVTQPGTSIWWTISWNQNYGAEGLITKMCGFNKMGPPLTLLDLQWLLFEQCLRCGDIPWPTWSPDLSMCDFFCGATSSHVYTKESHEH